MRIEGEGRGTELTVDSGVASLESGPPPIPLGDPPRSPVPGGRGAQGTPTPSRAGSRVLTPEAQPNSGLLGDGADRIGWRGHRGHLAIGRGAGEGRRERSDRSPASAPRSREEDRRDAAPSTRKRTPSTRPLTRLTRLGSTMTSPARQNRLHGTCGLVKSPDSSPAIHRGHAGRGAAPLPGEPVESGAPYCRRAGLQSGNSPRACGPWCLSGERRSILPARRTPVLQTGNVWSAGLQTGTGDRTKLGTCAALESGAPYCRRAGLQFSRPATYGAPVSRPARATGPGSVPVPLWTQVSHFVTLWCRNSMTGGPLESRRFPTGALQGSPPRRDPIPPSTALPTGLYSPSPVQLRQIRIVPHRRPRVKE